MLERGSEPLRAACWIIAIARDAIISINITVGGGVVCVCSGGGVGVGAVTCICRPVVGVRIWRVYCNQVLLLIK